VARYQPGAGKAQRKTSATKTYGRSKRSSNPHRKHWPLMPAELSVDQARWWFDHRYAS
jgi:hypothetical protein